MALHELATNATKYGALSSPEGQLRIEWGITGPEPESALRIIWRERGGPAVTGQPDRSGFGSTLLQATVERQLGGRLHCAWEREGLTCTLEMPAARVLAEVAVSEAPS
jgi:two-component sensor histidine kinase